ncbi:tyrosine-type recombinase/integrase [Megasphaera vaginalis (ex Srinivasan et al. 2021)]
MPSPSRPHKSSLFAGTAHFFNLNKSSLSRKLKSTAKKTGVKVIRLHDLRHSHASLLIEMGFSPLVIADRLGHEKITTTLQIYSHLYPHKQTEVSEKLDTVNFNF